MEKLTILYLPLGYKVENMKSSERTFVQLAKMLVNEKQAVSQVNLVETKDLPGSMLYIYTDTVLLKPNYKAIEYELLVLADRLKLQIAVQAPRCVGNVPVRKLSPLKRFLLIAIYSENNPNPCVEMSLRTH